VGVGERAAQQRRDEERHELHDAEETDHERRAGQLVHLERDRDVRDHRPRERDALADVEQPELAVPPQRTDVDGERAETAHGGRRG
jgi:hypothetical protein